MAKFRIIEKDGCIVIQQREFFIWWTALESDGMPITFHSFETAEKVLKETQSILYPEGIWVLMR